MARKKAAPPAPSEPPPPPTLRHLKVLARYQATRHPRLADLCEREAAAALAAHPREALAASKKRADIDRWAAIEAAGDALDSPRLGAAARGGQQHEVLRQVQALAKRDDPTLAASLLALLANPPYAGIASRDLVDAILAALEHTRDRRAADATRELGARYLGIVHSGTGRWICTRLGQIADALAALPLAELSDDDLALCDEIARERGETPPPPPAVAITRRTLADLLAEVYAAPAEDGPRHVYADMLLEQGDARGAWIVASLAGAPLPEVDRSALVGWAHPLSTGGDVKFARGFPVSIRLNREAASIAGVPAWSTIEQIDGIDVVAQKTALAILDAPSAAGVRRVATLSTPLLAKATASGARPWTTIGFQAARMPDAALFAKLPALAVATVNLDGNEAPPPDLLARLGGALREATVRVRGIDRLDVPPDLVALELRASAMPAWTHLATHANLRTLAIELPSYRGEPRPPALALPASLTKLSLHASAMPELVLAAPIERVALRVQNPLDTGTFAALAGTRALDVSANGQLPAGGLARMATLRELRISGGEVEAAELAPLRELVSLTMFAKATLDPPLADMPLEHLDWFGLPLAMVPALPRLRVARLRLPDDVAAFEALLARSPALRKLELHGRYGATPDTAFVRALVQCAATSPLERLAISCSLGHGPMHEIEMRRDAEGALQLVSKRTAPLDDAIYEALR